MAYLQCPKCAAENRPLCNRFHAIERDGKTYVVCERVKECGWEHEIPPFPAYHERKVDHERLDEDWEGNNIAITCPNPECRKVYIVSAMLHRDGRVCPKCGQSKGTVRGGRLNDGTASVIWPLKAAKAVSN